MSQIHTSRYKAPERRIKKRDEQGYIKKRFFTQTMLCIALFVLVLWGDKIFDSGDFIKKTAQFALNENTDFKKVWEETKGFFKEKVEFTAFLESQKEIDPVLTLVAPIKGEIISGFGLEKNEKTGEENFCYGVKILKEQGTVVTSAGEGTAVETGKSEKWGEYVLLAHSEKIYTFYAYLEDIQVSEGDSVRSAQAIGRIGKNPLDEKTMLYFEVRENENFLDPEAFVDFNEG